MRQEFLFTGPALRKDWPFGDLKPGSFGLVCCDPPWDFALWSKKGEAKSAQAQYATMSLDAIKALPVAELADRDAVLWLWATWPMLQQGLDVLRAWGFEYSTGGAWAKRTRHGKLAFGTGYRMRSACEPFLIGIRGNPRTTRSVRNLIDDEAREHSRKPEAAFRMAEELMPEASRVELFSRQSRPGWHAWGSEQGKFDQ